MNHDTQTIRPAIKNKRDLGAKDHADQVFDLLMTLTAWVVVVLVVCVTGFLVARAIPALQESKFAFFSENDWFPDATPSIFGVATLAYGTIVSSALALLLAMPIAVGSSICIVELAPKRLGIALGYLIDFLAAVPSVVYGLWGVVFLVPLLSSFASSVDNTLGFIPILHSRTGTYGRSMFCAGVVLAIMILPIIAALSREVFAQVPRSHKEAALALGATRWEMIRMAVLPYGRSGIIGAAMLGLGRALGETIAVALVLAASFDINWHIFEPGGNTIAANIATKFGESGDMGRQALIASGLVLFAITLVVNAVARLIISRSSISKARKK